MVESGTHAWNFVDKCFEYARNDREKAVCVGHMLHSSQDSVSHNFYVPDQAKRWKIVPEAVAHPFAELGVDEHYKQKYPNIVFEATYPLTEANIEEFCKGEDSIMRRASGISLGWECDALADAVGEGGFYQSVFLVGPVLKYGFQAFIKVASFFPLGDYGPYMEKAKQFSRDGFQERWHTELDPTGYEALRVSNLGWWIVAFIVIVALLVLVFGNLIKLLRR